MMFLTAAPDLLYVIGVPVLLLLLCSLLGTGIWVAMGRTLRR